jgi:hypothetical protein
MICATGVNAASKNGIGKRMIRPDELLRATGVRGLVWLLPFFLILHGANVARAQDVFASGSGAAPKTYTDQFSGSCIKGEPPNVFKQIGINPLVCHPQVGPQDSQKQCSYAGMTMVAHIGETCYYCVAIVPPINGIIIPMDQAQNAGNQGYSCVGDPVDPDCMIICQKPGKLTYTPPGPGGNVQQPVPSGEGPPPGYAPMPGPAGGIGYVAGPNPCLPKGPGGYDYCQNGPGARLPPGCSCTVTKVVTPPPKTIAPPPGSKGITNEPLPTPDAPTVPNIPAFEKAMTKCMSGKVPFAFPPTVSPKFRDMAINYYGPKAERNKPFAQLSPISQIFAEETAMALQMQATHDGIYGGDQYNYSDSIDYLVGWLDRCLMAAGLRPSTNDNSPNNPWRLYVGYTGVNPQDLDDQYFLKGYTTWGINPPSLKTPQPPSIVPGLLPLNKNPLPRSNNP